ncbi:MAG: SDR family NAD(P)-dependent oxidoreductase [Desulfuromonadales bacterium]|nr:MAG: SDR family NAD(P)-dependent oxidoreductase [Desulfuromonadales bacterium]
MATVLITGGAGFIGSHTADALLEEGHRVRILDCLDPQIHGDNVSFPSYLDSRVEHFMGDVRSFDDVKRALQGVDVIYHFAALTGVGQSMYDMRSYVETNCTGTATVIEAVLKSRISIDKFVLASSRAVYGEGTHWCPNDRDVYPGIRRRKDLEEGKFQVYCPVCAAELRAVSTREERPLLPISVYGWTKKFQEEMCHFAAQTFGLPVTILRYFNVYGSRQSLRNPYTGVMSIFYNRILAGQPISLYEHGTPGRDFVHVSDVVNANLKVLDADVIPGTCINVGTGNAVTIREIAAVLSACCNRQVDFLDLGEFRIGDISSCYADISKACSILGYTPSVDLKEGIGEFVEWASGQSSIDLYQRTVDELEKSGLFGRASRI